jgi:uncharacterized protein YecE (DUF72 family)
MLTSVDVCIDYIDMKLVGNVDMINIPCSLDEKINKTSIDNLLHSTPSSLYISICAPRNFLTSSSTMTIWSNFWVGKVSKIHECNRLKYIIIYAGGLNKPTTKNITRLKKLFNTLPSYLNFVLEFRNIEWMKKVSIFQKHKNVGIITPYVENRIVGPGWANFIPSTSPFKHKFGVPDIKYNIIYIALYGSYGDGYGSYDVNGFIDILAKNIKDYIKEGYEVVCNFKNNKSTLNYQLPRVMIDDDITVCPRTGNHSIDKICAYSDADVLKDTLLLMNTEIDDEGYYILKFVR